MAISFEDRQNRYPRATPQGNPVVGCTHIFCVLYALMGDAVQALDELVEMFARKPSIAKLLQNRGRLTQTRNLHTDLIALTRVDG